MKEKPEFAVRLARYSSNQVMSRHAHEQPGISVVLAGAVTEEASSSTVIATAGWTVIKPRGTYHANRFGPHGAVLLAVEPRRIDSGDDHLRWSWTDDVAVFRAALRLWRVVQGSTTCDTNEAMAELLACAVPDRTRPVDRPWLRRIKALLDDPNAPFLSVAELALGEGVHPVYLARQFRGAFGVSIRDYRQIIQVRRAAQHIVNSREGLSSIAQRCGFADHSHMCRSFRIVAGVSPRSLRAG